MAIVGRAYVELHGRTGQLERDIERSLAPSIKRLTKQINTDIGNSITDAFKKTKSSDLDLDVKGVGERAGRRILKELNKTLKEKIKVNLDIDKTSINDNARAITDRIQRRIDQVKFKVKEPFNPKDWKIPVDIDKTKLDWVRHQLDDIKDDYGKIEAKVQPNYGSAAGNLVAARLAWLTRARTVSILPVLQPGSVAAFSAQLLAALSGGRLVKSTLENIRDLFKNVDKQIPKISLITSAISGLSAWLMAAISNVGSLILDIARLAGLLIPLPGIVAGMGIGLGVFIAAIIDLNKVLPNIGNSFKLMREDISNAFWTQAASSVGAFFDEMLPQFSRGTVKVAGVMGTTFATFFTSLRKSLSGQVEPMFAQLARSINISSLATTAFANIIRVLGQHGADYLPELALWFNRIGTRFSNWLDRVSASGELRMWTDAGIAALHDLGQVLSGIGKIFFGIADAAQKAGASTLQTLGDRLQNIAKIVNSEPFKTRLIGVFKATHEMMDTIARISGPAVTDFFEDLATVIDQTFKNLGPAIGNIIKGLASALASPTFIKGFNEFTSGLADGINAVTEALPAVGRAVGSILPIIGEMARQFGPIIADVLRAVANLAVGVVPALMPIIDVLTTILGAIAELPAPVLAAAAAFVFLRGPLSGMSGFFSDIALSLTNFLAQARGTAAIQNVGQQFGVLKVAGAGLAIAINGVGAALKAAFISNVPLLAITAIVTVLAYFATQAAEAKRVADELAETLDDTTAAFTDASRLWTIDHFNESIENADWSRLDELGFGLDEITIAAAQGDEALIALRDRAKELGDSLGVQAHNAGESWNQLFGKDQPLGENAGALHDLTRVLDGYIDATDTAVASKRREIEALEAVGIYADDSAVALARARLEEERSTQIRNIATGAIDAQITSLQALLALKREEAGKTLSYRETMRGLEKSYQDVRDEVAAYLEDNAANLDAMNRTTESGRALEEAFDGIVKSTNEAVDAAHDHNASQAEINRIVENSRKQFIDYASAVLGGTDEAKAAAEALADELGLLPENYNFEATIDTTKALFDLDGLKVEIDKTTAAITVDGNTVPASATLAEIVGNVNQTTGTVTIDGRDYPARTTIGEFLSYAGVVEARVQVGADTSDAYQGRQVFVDSTGQMRILVPMDVDVTAAQDNTMTWMDRVAQSVYPQLKVSADTTGITEAVNTATNNVSGTTATISVDGSTTGFQNSVSNAVQNVQNTTATINIVGNGTQAARRRDELVSSINGANATIKILGDGSNAAKRRTELINSINSATPTLKILGNGSNAARRRDELVNSINRAVATMKIYADTSYARSSVNTFVANTNSRTATVTVYARTVGEFANGGIAAYANGGVRRKAEQHTAHIARTLRVFGEPETGGEAYIPLALSKRLRSSKILKQVAEMMGYQVVPKNARAFADGGILSKANVQVIQVPSSDTRIDAIVSQTPEGQVINNYFTINTNGEVDVHTLAREVSREIMYAGG